MKTPILLFSGQGAQCAGMGRTLAEDDAETMDLWKRAEQVSGLSLRDIFWEGDEAAMSDTRALQPALLVVEVSLWKRVHAQVSPRGAAGHSLGEYSALVAAGVLDVASALEITALRGRLMASADPEGRGGMLAVVKLDADTVASILAEVCAEGGEQVIAANFNAPQQTVVSGPRSGLEAVAAKVRAHKGRSISLAVRGAFHSPMMTEANAELAPLLQRVSWHDARFPVYGNVDGQGEVRGEALRAKMLRQMVSPVAWVATVRTQFADGARSWLEMGPRSLLNKLVLTTLAGETDQALETRALTNLSDVQAFLGE